MIKKRLGRITFLPECVKEYIMRSHLSPIEFLQKMKKKPALQKIMDNFDEYSIDDLKEIDQPKWIREALIQVKENHMVFNDQERMDNIEKMADIMENSSFENKDQEEYEVRTYFGSSWFPEVISGLSVEFNHNDLFIVIAPKKVRISSTILGLPESSWQALMQQSKQEGYMTLHEFNLFYQKKMNDKYQSSDISPTNVNDAGNIAEPNNDSEESTDVLGQYNVKIQRN